MQDLAAADILFACRTDSGGRLFNLVLAVGYANALGKQILFVNQGDHYSHAYDYVKPFADGYFTTLDVDWPFGNYVLKADAGWFPKKNVYSYYKRTSDNASIFNTVSVPHTAVALSLERKFDNFFLMPVFAHRSLAKVPGGTHIIGFENKETTASEARDLQKSQFGLVFILDTSETWNTTLSLLQSAPFKQTTATNVWTFKPGGENHEFQLKFFHTASEKLLMTGKPIKSDKAFLQYQYTL